MAKETTSLLKPGEISLIEAENEANKALSASFPTKISGISTIFTRHPTHTKVSFNLNAEDGLSLASIAITANVKMNQYKQEILG